jgi:hypothetical protein
MFSGLDDPVLLTAKQWCSQTGTNSDAVYTSPTWGTAEAPPPDSTCGAGYFVAFRFGVKDFGCAGGVTYRP